jgi:hypothetical protein
MEISRIVTTSKDENNFVGAQVEDFGDGTPFSELYSLGGFRFVPWDSDDKGSCTAIQVEDGSDNFVLPGTDPRMIPFLPDGNPGTVTMASFDGSRCDFGYLDEKGYSLIVHDGDKDHVISVNKETHTISFIQKDGTAVELNSTIVVSGGWSPTRVR